MNNKLGTIICELRKKKGLTQKDLAEALNVSDKAVSRWETGNSYPDLDMIFEISKYFNVTFSDLLKARISEDSEDDGVEKEIINEFSQINKKNAKKVKIILLITLLVTLVLTIVIIFTNTYNRFKVYNVNFENTTDFYKTNSVYIETNIRDLFNIGNIKLKNYNIKDTDTISVNLYYLENNEEKTIYNYTNLDNIFFSDSQSYIPIDNLSNFFDRLYLKVVIINNKNEIIEYKTKLNFMLSFSNNKSFEQNEINGFKSKKNVDSENITKILLNNGFIKTTNTFIVKNDKKYQIIYDNSLNKIIYSYYKNNLNYRYTYDLTTEILEVLVFDQNNTEIEKYKYDNVNGKVLNCITGSCNDFEMAMNLLNKDILFLFE